MPKDLKTDAARLLDASEIIRQKNTRIIQLERELRERYALNDSAEAIRKEIFGLSEYTPEPPKWIERSAGRSSTGVPMVFASDWHWGETVDPDQVGGANKFNRAVAKQRVRILYETVCDLCFHHMTHPNYPGIVLCVGGDMITGAIHDDLRETNDGPVSVSVMEVTDNLIALILLLAKKFGKIFVPCVPGNHGRNTLKPREKNSIYDSYEWIIYQILERYFRDDPRVAIYTPNAVDAHFTVQGHRFMLTHGDRMGVKGGDGIIGVLGPIARGVIKVANAEARVGRDFDTLLIGHYHVYMPRGDASAVVVNGSLIGFNEFAHLRLRAPMARPTQALWFMHEKHGFTAQWPMYLDNKAVKSKEPWIAWGTDLTL